MWAKHGAPTGKRTRPSENQAAGFPALPSNKPRWLLDPQYTGTLRYSWKPRYAFMKIQAALCKRDEPPQGLPRECLQSLICLIGIFRVLVPHQSYRTQPRSMGDIFCGA